MRLTHSLRVRLPLGFVGRLFSLVWFCGSFVFFGLVWWVVCFLWFGFVGRLFSLVWFGFSLLFIVLRWPFLRKAAGFVG